MELLPFHYPLCQRFAASGSQPSAPDDPAPLIPGMFWSAEVCGACCACSSSSSVATQAARAAVMRRGAQQPAAPCCWTCRSCPSDATCVCALPPPTTAQQSLQSNAAYCSDVLLDTPKGRHSVFWWKPLYGNYTGHPIQVMRCRASVQLRCILHAVALLPACNAAPCRAQCCSCMRSSPAAMHHAVQCAGGGAQLRHRGAPPARALGAEWHLSHRR